jgi:rare lipoprotein A
MVMARVYHRVRLLPAAFVLSLFVAGCVVSSPVQEIRPTPSLEAPVATPSAAMAVVLPSSGEEPGPAPSAETASVQVEASVPTVVEAAPAEVPPPAPEPLPAAEVAPAEEEGMQGIASYYARRFNGRPTTSGAIYDPDKLTAAHQSLPFGTKVKVVNLANGREVTVTVNDRCRKRTFPFIDLSRAAAKQLGFFGKGITKVRIIPMPSGEQ